ncbi:MAG: hypothetical protein ACK5LE_03560 [Alphaproteobacteria bacterium]
MAGLETNPKGNAAECIAYELIYAHNLDTTETKRQIYNHNLIYSQRCNK